MDRPSQPVDALPPRSSPAPVPRRIGAHLLDSGLSLLVAYLFTVLIAPAYQLGFGDLFVAVGQSFIIGWVVLKDAWWPGQSLGKRIAHVRIIEVKSENPASRLRCVGRQAVFVLVLTIITVPAYLWTSGSAELFKTGFLSAVLTAGGPIRLLPLLPAALNDTSNSIRIAQLVAAGFILLELALVGGRGPRRRIVDRIAGTQVADDRTLHRP